MKLRFAARRVDIATLPKRTLCEVKSARCGRAYKSRENLYRHRRYSLSSTVGKTAFRIFVLFLHTHGSIFHSQPRHRPSKAVRKLAC